MIHKTDWTNDVSIVDDANLNRIEGNIEELDNTTTNMESELTTKINNVNRKLNLTLLRSSSVTPVTIGKNFDLGITNVEANGHTFVCNISNAVASATPIALSMVGYTNSNFNGTTIRMIGAYASGTNGTAHQYCQLAYVSGTTWKLVNAHTTYSFSTAAGIPGKLFAIGYVK